MNNQQTGNDLFQITPEEMQTLVQGVIVGFLMIAFFVGLCLAMDLTLSIDFGMPRV